MSNEKHCIYCDKCVHVGESLKCKRLGGKRYLDLPEERSCICFKDARGVWLGTIKEAEERFNERKVESLCYLPSKKYDEDNGEQPKFNILDDVICDGEEGKGRIFKIGCKEEYGYKYWVKFDNGRECWCAGRGLHMAPATTDAVNSIVKEIPADLYDRLLKLGIIDDSGVRDHNVGASDYPKRTIQAWSIWIDWELDPWEADIVKRIGRTKIEPGMTPTHQRILDFNKIIHICQEKIRQLELSEQNNTNSNK